MSLKNAAIVLLPGLYTYKTRIQPEGLKALKFHSTYLITVLPLLAESLMRLIFEGLFHLFLMTLSKLILSFVTLYLIYEIWYVVNDFVSVKREVAPTHRAKDISLNVYAFIILRSVMFIIIALLLLNQRVQDLSPRDLSFLYIVMCIFVVGMFHNFNPNNLTRNVSHATMRILRFSYPAVYVGGLGTLPACIIALMPLIILDEISYIVYQLNKVFCRETNKTIKLPRAPLLFHLSAILPLQIMALIAIKMPWYIFGNVVLILFSLIRRLRKIQLFKSKNAVLINEARNYYRPRWYAYTI